MVIVVEDAEDAVPVVQRVQEGSAITSPEFALVHSRVSIPHHGEDGAECFGGVQVVVHSIFKRLAGGAGTILQSGILPRREWLLGKPKAEIPEPVDGLLRLVQAIKGEVQMPAVRDRGQQVSDRRGLVSLG